MTDVRLLVFGSRSITSGALVNNVINDALRKWEIEVSSLECLVSGGARGVDQLAELWAGPAGVPIRQFLPDWEGRGRRAGFERNLQMLDFIALAPRPLAIGIWDGSSRGTKHTLDEAARRGIPLHTLVYNVYAPPAGQQREASRLPKIRVPPKGL